MRPVYAVHDAAGEWVSLHSDPCAAIDHCTRIGGTVRVVRQPVAWTDTQLERWSDPARLRQRAALLGVDRG